MENAQTLVLNDEFSLPCPEGFQIMSEAERAKVITSGDGQWIGLSNPDAHILITIGWKHINGLSSMMVSEKDLKKTMEKQILHAMSSFGVRSDGDRERVIGGMKACGFEYEYTSQGTEMYAESYAAKKGKAVYYFHFYARSALKQESIPVWENMLDQITEK